MEGFLLIDKPAGMTSHDVVDYVRRLLRPPNNGSWKLKVGGRNRILERNNHLQLPTSNLQPPKVGHAGTLDPFATGLLIVGVGRAATREMQKLVGLDKEYEAVFVLGASSTTDDTEGEITPAPLTTPLTVAPGFPARHSSQSDGGGMGAIQVQPEPRIPPEADPPSAEKPGATASAIHTQPEPGLKPGATRIEDVLKQFIGEIEQIPPTYSAIKVGGKKMYEEARAGRPMEGKARRVTIYSMSLRGGRQADEAISAHGIASSVDENLPPRNDTMRVALTIRCSSGTYIRALARDLGRALGGGGYVEKLRRTAIGPFSSNQAVALEQLDEHLETSLIPISRFLNAL